MPTKILDGVEIELTAEEIAAGDARAEAFDLDLNPVRSHRDGLLFGSDWTQVADVALSAEKVAEWATYRQALRDYPSQSDRQSTLPDWPTPPE